VISGVDEPGILFDIATFPMATRITLGSESPGILSIYPPLPEIYGGNTKSVLRHGHADKHAPLCLDRVRSVYWRRPRSCLVDDALTHPELRQYAAKSSRHTIEGLVEQLAGHCRIVDSPSAVGRQA
jgi:hypothetical protein